MATQQEWREYFELVNNRKPTLEEFQAALKNGEISSNLTEAKNEPVKVDSPAQPTIFPSSGVPKKKSKKRLWIIVAIVLVLGIAGGVFGYVKYRNYKTLHAMDGNYHLILQAYQETLSFDDNGIPISDLEKSGPEVVTSWANAKISGDKITIAYFGQQGYSGKLGGAQDVTYTIDRKKQEFIGAKDANGFTSIIKYSDTAGVLKLRSNGGTGSETKFDSAGTLVWEKSNRYQTIQKVTRLNSDEQYRPVN